MGLVRYKEHNVIPAPGVLSCLQMVRHGNRWKLGSEGKALMTHVVKAQEGVAHGCSGQVAVAQWKEH